MKFSSIVLMILPMVAFSVPKTFVSTPFAGGKAVPLGDGTILPDGTWVVADTLEGSVYYSTDRGGHWNQTPIQSPDLPSHLFGNAVLSSDDRSYWMPSTGWKPMVLPTSLIPETDAFLANTGERAILNASGSKAIYYFSKDSLRTWTELFQIDTSLVPGGEAKDLTFTKVGDKFWFSIPDSGYLRGTSDGKAWVRAPLPDGFMVDMIQPDLTGSEIRVMGFDSNDPGNFLLASTSNLGVNWNVGSGDQPGAMFLPLGDHLYLSTSVIDLEIGGSTWLSRSQLGPWTEIDSIDPYSCFSDAGVVYAVASEGIYRIDLPMVSVVAKQGLSKFTTTRSGSSILLDLPPEMLGMDWWVGGIDGIQLASGTIRSKRLTISVPKNAWIRVGDRTQKLPPF